MSTEKMIEQKATRKLREHGVESIKLQVGRAGTAGWPDRLYLLRGGIVVFVEFKRSPASKTTALQSARIEKLKRMGFRVFVCCDADEAVQRVLSCRFAPSDVLVRDQSED